MSEDVLKIEIIDLPAQHGGAWKVAYADFVTAMMAFFLLMWLLNAVTEEQKNAISDYFSPSHPQISSNTSGAGGLLGGLTMSPDGAMASQKSPLIPIQVTQARKRGDNQKSKVAQQKEKAEQKRFEKAAQKLKEKIEKDPRLAELAKNVMIDITPEGLRIQIVDQEGKPMFPSGSAKLFEKTRFLISQITEIVLDMPNEISVRGHTDATRYAKGATYTNWELSSDRANASRRAMIDSGIPKDRLNNVMGKADTQPLIADNVLDPRNRRITLILLKEELTNPAAYVEESDIEESDEAETEFTPPARPIPPINPYEKTPGAVEFP